MASELNPAGILIFEMGEDPQLLEVHVYTTRKYSGTVTESDGKNTNSLNFNYRQLSAKNRCFFEEFCEIQDCLNTSRWKRLKCLSTA